MSSEMAANGGDVLNAKLTQLGWHLSTQGLKTVTDDNRFSDVTSVTNNALNTDIKDIGKPVLAEMITKKNIDNLVVQIQKVRNISAPKANEESQAAPRMLKLILTDGLTHCQAIECDPIATLNLQKTPPGAKVHLKNASVSSGYILLNPLTCKYLGGRVPNLYDRWELNRNISNSKRGEFDGDGPPPWVNFGKRIAPGGAVIGDKDFRSIEEKKTDKVTEFELQRKDAIAEAASGGAVKKVFGGGAKVMKQTFEENAERRTFKKSDRPPPMRKGRKGGREENEERPQKPSESVSLFAFLEDKLAVNVDNGGGGTINKVSTPSWKEEGNGFKSGNNYREIGGNYRGNNYRGRNNYSAGNYREGGGNFREGGGNYRETGGNFREGGVNYREVGGNYREGGNYRDRDVNNYKGNKPINNFNKTNTYDKNINNYKKETSYQESKPKEARASPIETITNNFEKINVNANYASKAFRQHLNIPNDFGGPKQNGHFETTSSSNQWKFNVGDQCMAKYWEDNKYYNATITGMTPKTIVVKFNDYGNTEEVLAVDCIPITDETTENTILDHKSPRNKAPYNRNQKNYTNRNYNNSNRYNN